MILVPLRFCLRLFAVEQTTCGYLTTTYELYEFTGLPWTRWMDTAHKSSTLGLLPVFSAANASNVVFKAEMSQVTRRDAICVTTRQINQKLSCVCAFLLAVLRVRRLENSNKRDEKRKKKGPRSDFSLQLLAML